MIDRKKVFKTLLTGSNRTYKDLDLDLWKCMHVRHGWSLTLHPTKNQQIAFKTVDRDVFYIRPAYENSLEWHSDIEKALQLMGPENNEHS